MKGKITEAALHRAVAQYLTRALPRNVWWTTFPAGGGGFKRGVALKAMGLAPGVPDILIMRDGCAFWIELKTRMGKVSLEQELCHQKLQAMRCGVEVCRSLADVQETLIGWGIPVTGKL
jgi:hypothetical protein